MRLTCRKGATMKILISNIYNDNHNLFTDNTFLASDDRLTDILELGEDLDLIVEMTYGNREIFKRYLNEDNDEIFVYDLSKIHKSVYATIIENLLKYKLMLQTDAEIQDVNPLHQFYEKKEIGERVRENDVASRVDTTTHGTVNNTKTFGDVGQTTVHGTINGTSTYGQVTEQNVVGQAVNSTQLGAREQTDAVTSFSSSTFENTDKTTQAQTTDQQTLGSHTDTITTSHATPDSEQITQGNDTVTTTHGNDTEQITRGNDSLTHGAHKDTITDTASEDERYGYTDITKELDKRRTYATRNTLNEIIRDVINGVTYGVYTF